MPPPDRGQVNIASLDLNLLLALDALLSEANVTRAAERLNLTQPTLSAALSRLRRHFGDELLLRVGNTLELTPLALRLRPLVADGIASATRVFGAHLDFDPRTSKRRFSILSSDYGIGAAGTRWSNTVARRAPHIRMVFSTVAEKNLSPPEVRLRDVDGVLAPQGFFPESIPHIDVLDDRWVIIADPRNRALSDEPTVEELSALPWATAFESLRIAPAGVNHQQWLAIASHTSVVVNGFSAIPLCVRGTSRVALMQEALLDALGTRDQLRVLPPPISMEPIRLSFWWHPVFDNDVEHIWLRAQLEASRAPENAQGAQEAGPITP